MIHLVTDAKGTVIHEVHVQMQELPLGMKALAPEVRAGKGGGLCPLSAGLPAGQWLRWGQDQSGLPSWCTVWLQGRRETNGMPWGREGQGAGGEVERAVGLPQAMHSAPEAPWLCPV